MEKQTVFIKRYPNKGELPRAEQHVIVGWNEEPLSTRVANRSENGYWFLSDDACDCDEPDYWFEPIEVPSEEEMQSEIYHESMEAEHAYDFQQGAKHMQNFILNHLKSADGNIHTNEKGQSS